MPAGSLAVQSGDCSCGRNSLGKGGGGGGRRREERGRRRKEKGGWRREEAVTQVCCVWYGPYGFFLTSPVEIQSFLSLLLFDSLVEKGHCFTETPPPEDKTHITKLQNYLEG